MTKGFTLIELVIGMVVLAIAMMVMNTMLIAQSKDALEPLYRMRSAQLGQGIIHGILVRDYDSEDAGDYDEIADFISDDFTSVVDSAIVIKLFGEVLPEQYENYGVKIAVESDVNPMQIDVTIKTPSDEQIVFSALKGDY